MIDIKTQYAGLTLRNPIIVGSSGLTNKAERNRCFSFSQISFLYITFPF